MPDKECCICGKELEWNSSDGNWCICVYEGKFCFDIDFGFYNHSCKECHDKWCEEYEKFQKKCMETSINEFLIL